MNFLRKLFSGGEQTPHPRSAVRPEQWRTGMKDTVTAQLYEGRADLEVVGESNYQDNLWRLVGGGSPADRVLVDVYAVLEAETDNEYDTNAVAVWVNGLKVGYLSRGDAERYRPGLVALESKHGKPIALPGVIAGGGMREDGPGRLGVFLRHDPVDFGLRGSPLRPPPNARMRTGLSDALVTDEADDSYDLSWISDLPSDDIQAIRMLRRLLEQDSDPIGRHFMFAHLEAILYRSREAFASALDEYDEACRQHDAEMDCTREAFVTKWGSVPILETYRQMAVRQQKARNLGQALWWAERGIALYGSECSRPEAVQDLKKRAETYRARLEPKPGRSPGTLP